MLLAFVAGRVGHDTAGLGPLAAIACAALEHCDRPPEAGAVLVVLDA